MKTFLGKNFLVLYNLDEECSLCFAEDEAKDKDKRMTASVSPPVKRQRPKSVEPPPEEKRPKMPTYNRKDVQNYMRKKQSQAKQIVSQIKRN